VLPELDDLHHEYSSSSVRITSDIVFNNKLKSNKSPGPDGLHPLALRLQPNFVYLLACCLGDHWMKDFYQMIGREPI